MGRGIATSARPLDLGWRGDPADLVAALDGDDAGRHLVRWIAANTPPWMADAACRHSGVDFFPTSPGGGAHLAALRLCATCPVLDDCREWALTLPPPDSGIIGGMGARARMTERERRARAAARRAPEAAQ